MEPPGHEVATKSKKVFCGRGSLMHGDASTPLSMTPVTRKDVIIAQEIATPLSRLAIPPTFQNYLTIKASVNHQA